MAYQKNVNVNVLAESGMTDEETIQMYEKKFPQITLDLKGKEELNTALFDIEYQRNLSAIQEHYVDQRYSEVESTKLAQKESDVLRTNALSNYEKLKRKRAQSK